MKTSMTIEEAVHVSSFMLSKKVAAAIIAHALMLEGFTPNKANIIVRWATQRNLNLAEPIISEEEFKEICNSSKIPTMPSINIPSFDNIFGDKDPKDIA